MASMAQYTARTALRILALRVAAAAADGRWVALLLAGRTRANAGTCWLPLGSDKAWPFLAATCCRSLRLCRPPDVPPAPMAAALGIIFAGWTEPAVHVMCYLPYRRIVQ